ncbi:MAG: hypothetical protein RMK30_00595 [Anaerolineae bacterium]|nr:hypothetical protein [Anaerolineae bacterium]MDW8101368.1 hypothetical protein [Anaerolineae bacterium]
MEEKDFLEGFDPELREFVREKIDSFIKWDLLKLLYSNPHTVDTAERLARQCGRSVESVLKNLEEMVREGLLEMHLVAGIPVYSITKNENTRRLIENFLEACKNRQVRVRVVYHILKRQEVSFEKG